MLKTLIKIRLQGFISRQTRSSRHNKSGVGKVILMSLLFIYVAVVFFVLFGGIFQMIVKPFHSIGMDWLYFALMSLIIIGLCFVGSVFVVHHELYEAKDNDILLSMPIKTQDILLSRVFVILILDYIYELIIAGPALFIYINEIGMTFLQVILFISVFLTLPLFVLALTCFFGWILAHVLVHVRKKNIISLVLFVVFMFGYIFGMSRIESYMTWLIQNGKSIGESIEKALFPIYHLGIAIQNENIISFFIYLVCALIPFIIVMVVLSYNFIKLATTRPKSKKIEYQEKPMKSHHIMVALLIRELRHFTSNAMVMMNGAVGILMSIIAIVAMIYYQNDIKYALQQMPMLQPMVAPILCALVLSVSSMNIISASSISLEGDRLWIIQSLPIQSIDILNVKLLMHILLCVPAGFILSIVGCILFPVHLLECVYVCLLPALFTIFIANMGLLMNLWKPKFDWINETVCVKQSMPVMLTMFISMGMVFVIVFVYMKVFEPIISIELYFMLLFGMFVVVDIILYYLIYTWGRQRFEQL